MLLTMINVLICDDDLYTSKVLKKVIEENDEVKEIYLAENGEEAVDAVKNNDIDLAFMDIDMPKLDGLEAAKMMISLDSDLKVVFITAFPEYACDSYDLRALDYILKPIDFHRVNENIERLIQQSHGEKFHDSLKENNILMIKDKQEYYFIKMEDINYIEKQDKQLIIHTKDKEYSTRMGLNEIEEKLNQNFFRAHKSYIVNLKNIEKIEPYGDSSYIIYFENTDKVKNALITKNNIHILRE